MTKENAHLYLPLVQALAEGKEIQYRRPNAEWVNIHGETSFLDEPDFYRIKPEPVMVPLSAEDVPPGSVVRRASFADGRWAAIMGVAAGGIIFNNTRYEVKGLLWQELLDQSYLIKRPGQDWQPCHKISA